MQVRTSVRTSSCPTGTRGSLSTQETGYLSTVVGFGREAALELGRVDEALELADETERLAQRDDFEPHARLRMV